MFVVALSFFLVALSAQASVVSVSPSSQLTSPGSKIIVSVQADFSDVAGGASGGGFQLRWDPMMLALNETNSSATSDVSSGFAYKNIDQGAGTLDFAYSLCPMGTDNCSGLTNFSLYQLEFDVNASGAGSQTALNLGVSTIGDVWISGDGTSQLPQPTYQLASVTLDNGIQPDNTTTPADQSSDDNTADNSVIVADATSNNNSTSNNTNADPVTSSSAQSLNGETSQGGGAALSPWLVLFILLFFMYQRSPTSKRQPAAF